MQIFESDFLLNFILKPVPAAGFKYSKLYPPGWLAEFMLANTTKPNKPLGVMSLRYSVSK
jgi:hypothetical protein